MFTLIEVGEKLKNAREEKGVSVKEAAEDKNVYKSVGYYQLDYLVQQCRNKFAMNEDLWKKIDSLEAYTNSYAPYHIGNKEWLKMEKYLSVLTVFEEDISVALDTALAVNILPVVISLLAGKIKQGDKDLTETMEQLFGEEKIALCRKVIKGNGSAEN